MFTKDVVADIVYNVCSDKTLNHSQTVSKVCDAMGVSTNPKLEDAIRKYRQTGSGLESTAGSIIDSFNTSCPAGNCDTNCTGNCNSCGNTDCDPFKDFQQRCAFTAMDFAQKFDAQILFDTMMNRLYNKFL